MEVVDTVVAGVVAAVAEVQVVEEVGDGHLERHSLQKNYLC